MADAWRPVDGFPAGVGFMSSSVMIAFQLFGNPPRAGARVGPSLGRDSVAHIEGFD